MSRRPLRALALTGSPLLNALGVSSWPQARVEARRELAGRACSCCVSAQVHLTRYLGSTLFFDDDPEKLRAALPQAERLTARTIAACIVLHGRERVDLFPRS